MDARELCLCAICGEEKSAEDRWFLITESRWQDKLKILHWDDRLAAQAGIYPACSPAHVQETVLHWMATGGLDYPFARVSAMGRKRSGLRRGILLSEPEEVDTSGARQIGELSVDRESIRRVLSENPYSLSAILDALLSALERDPSRTESGMEADGVLRPIPQEI
ncbi:MAG TPA: hypothetical protein VMT28_09720 [Terriglobales bacterium]|jgi:hypothetical protein|nr:hypothetical protein [Terriglobales bacterium]